MQDAFGIVIFAVVGISAVLAVVSLFFRPAANQSHPPGHVDTVQRDAEIRQMLAARNARAAARGEAEVDVEDELQRLTKPAVDPGLRAEVRELVVARNRRREARGEPPLDVEREVERQLRELGA